MARHPLDIARIIDKAAHLHILLIKFPKLRRVFQRLVERNSQLLRYEFGNFIHFAVAHVHHAPHIANSAFRRHCTKCYNLRHMVVAVTAFYVFDNFIAADIAKIDINIRHRYALRI